MNNISNQDLLPLVEQAYSAFSAGNVAEAFGFRMQLNRKLTERGQSPDQFWADFQAAAELLSSKK